MTTLCMTVNGKPVELDVPESRYLAEVLRFDLGLTGTKIGCNEAECGICTVIVDGLPVDSCIYPAFKAQGARVETIEGLMQGRQTAPAPAGLHRTRRGAVRLLHPGPDHDRQGADRRQDRRRRSGERGRHQGRPEGYLLPLYRLPQRDQRHPPGRRARPSKPYIPAVQAPGPRRWDAPCPTPMSWPRSPARANYTDDLIFPGMVHARTKRAGVPHARIVSIDTRRAEAMPGVLAVLTHQRRARTQPPWPGLGGLAGAVRRQGALRRRCRGGGGRGNPRRGRGRAGADRRAIRSTAGGGGSGKRPPTRTRRWCTTIGPTATCSSTSRSARARWTTGLREADVVIEKTYRTPMTEHLFLEPECSIGVPAGLQPRGLRRRGGPPAERGPTFVHDKVTVYVGSQIPYLDRDPRSRPPWTVTRSRSVSWPPSWAAGSAGKEDIAGQIHVALLAERTGRPVKMLYTRAGEPDVPPQAARHGDPAQDRRHARTGA